MNAYERSAVLYFLVDDIRESRNRLIRIAEELMPEEQLLQIQGSIDSLAKAIAPLAGAALRAKRQAQAVQVLSESDKLLDQLTRSVELQDRKWRNSIVFFNGKKQ